MDPHEHHHQHDADEHHHFIDAPAPPPLGPAGLDNYSTDIYHPIPIQQEPIIEHEPYRPPRLSRDEIYALQVSGCKSVCSVFSGRATVRPPLRVVSCRLSIGLQQSDTSSCTPFQWEENYLKLEGVYYCSCKAASGQTH